jgi:hypothetical protein
VVLREAVISGQTSLPCSFVEARAGEYRDGPDRCRGEKRPAAQFPWVRHVVLLADTGYFTLAVVAKDGLW